MKLYWSLHSVTKVASQLSYRTQIEQLLLFSQGTLAWVEAKSAWPNHMGQLTSLWCCFPMDIYLHQVKKISPTHSPHNVGRNSAFAVTSFQNVFNRDTADKSGLHESEILNMASPVLIQNYYTQNFFSSPFKACSVDVLYFLCGTHVNMHI